MKLNILAFGVHPDDIELGCGGTLLKHIDQGKTVGLCDLTKGELGTRGSAELRLQEAEKAKEVMGAVVRENLGMPDGNIQINNDSITEIIKVIRRYKPDIVLANAPKDRHPDHGQAAQLVKEACFYSGLRKRETDQEPRRPRSLYHYIQDRLLEPDFVVDMTDYRDHKHQLIMAYASQFFDPNSQEPETPISSKSFIDYIDAQNRVLARPLGVDYAEGFIADRTIGVESFFNLQ